ncbi:MAG: molybdate ABC transporter substrate-binding protein [Hylemonella sp.]|nr:molybdate ABC transporter substrate-binding protein [Hylemonella sp.]
MPDRNHAAVALSGPRRRQCLGWLTLGLAIRPAWASPPVLRVAAASDLKFVLAQLLETFQKETGLRVEASYGSSGNFARQIRQGLPVHLFMSADEAWVQPLVDAGQTRVLANGERDRGVVYGLGRIALFVPLGSTLTLDPELKGVRAGWANIGKFAIANPEHAPYGRAAREALERLGLWEMVKPKLVLGENIAQATQFVSTGAAQVGITALALALAPEVAKHGRHLVLPETLHLPMRQRMVLLKDAPAAAQRLYDYLQTPAARAVFQHYGFVV